MLPLCAACSPALLDAGAPRRPECRGIPFQSWTLSAQAIAEIAQCRGEAQRRRFAVQLCPLRTYGRFLPKAVPAPVAITNYLARRLDLPLVLFGEIPERLATETDHLPRIRPYLGWRLFDEEARARLTHWLTQRATDDVLPHDLVTRAEGAPPELADCGAGPVHTRGTCGVRDRAGPSRGLHPDHDGAPASAAPGIRRPAPGAHRRPPLAAVSAEGISPGTSSAVLLRYIARYHFLQGLGVSPIDFRSVSPPLIRYFAAMTKRYDVRALRRFPAAKRAALTACFLVEVPKTILDHIVALHDQLLTKKMRKTPMPLSNTTATSHRQSRRGFATLITTGETLLDPERAPDTTLATLRHELGETTLRDAVTICTERQRLEERGEIDALRALPQGYGAICRLFRLALQGEPGSDAILAGLTLIRQLDAGTQKALSWLAPTAFVPRKFWPGLANTDGRSTADMGARAGRCRAGWLTGGGCVSPGEPATRLLCESGL